jgi:hypothetical protein
MFDSQIPIETINALTQVGAAGIMGMLWVWERLLSRRRERQLTEAHDRLLQQREHLRILIKLVRRNTQAIERFEQTQIQLGQIMENMKYEIRGRTE